MAKITFITKQGNRIVTEATSGSIMEVALKNNVKGIDGDCGGVCSCATCHVHVDPAFFEITGGPSDIEADMLELDDNANAFSRLGCQIQVSEALDGIELEVANE